MPFPIELHHRVGEPTADNHAFAAHAVLVGVENAVVVGVRQFQAGAFTLPRPRCAQRHAGAGRGGRAGGLSPGPAVDQVSGHKMQVLVVPALAVWLRVVG